MKSRLIILGCGSSLGVPRIDGHWGECKKKNKKNIRTRSSAIIIKGKNKILIDASPDIKNQFLKNNINDISSVIFSHEHADQTNGLFELRPFFWKNKNKINIYGNKKTIHYLKLRNDYLFKNKKNYHAMLNANIIKKSAFSLGYSKEKILFNTINSKHGATHSVVYIFEKVAYISDTNDLSLAKNNRLKNLNHLIIDCLKYKKHPCHFNLSESLYVHNQLKPKKTILTNLHQDIDYDQLLKKLPKNVIPAYDGLSINL